MRRASLIALLLLLATCTKVTPTQLTGTPVVITATVSPTPTHKPPTATTVPSRTPTATPSSPTPASGGYFWHGKYWIPGMVSYDTLSLSMPDLVVGVADSYGPGMMELVADNTGRYYGSEYVGAVALMFCADIGDSVWLRRPLGDYEGPFYVMDCARPADIYGMVVYMKIVVEVDYNTAVRWGASVVYGVTVSKLPPGQINREPTDLRSWFLGNVTFEP